MPAVTVENILSLPKIEATEGSERPVLSLTQAPSGFEGEGFPVRRAFAGVDLARLDPFVHMDQMGEVNYAPGEPKGTAWHPHRGFETVTYMIDGTFQHQDSAGGGGVITNGDTQWMTAGAGILHIEAPPESLVTSGGLFHGIQLWVNLPAADKWVPPRYQDIRSGEVALVASPDGGALVRVIAGEVGRARRARVDPYAHGHGPRHGERRGPTGPALAAGVQRPRLRPGRPRHRGNPGRGGGDGEHGRLR
jgi:redox-sensitive bicupin YhaK (pirin superfamily)